jgi:hypothetical protein
MVVNNEYRIQELRIVIEYFFVNRQLKNMKALFIGLFTFSFLFAADAQTVDTEALKNFDGGIVSKVYAIAKYTRLSKAEQVYLANYYKIADSVTKAWILQGRPSEQIDSVQNRSNRVFYELTNIDVARKSEFAYKNAEQFASVASRGEMDYMKDEYRPGDIEYKILQQWISNKYNLIYQRYLMNPRDQLSAKESSRLYDLYNLYPALYSNKFINDYIDKLNTIRIIPDSTQLKMRNSFLNAIKADKYSDWSKNLLNITRSIMPDTSLFSKLYGSEIMNEAVVSTAIDRYNLINIEHISLNAFKAVYNLILEKNYKNSLIEYTYGAFNVRLVDSLIAKTSVRYDSTIKALLFRDGSLLPTNQFSIALKYKDFLDIKSLTVIDSLVYHAMFLSHQLDSIRLRDPFGYIDFGEYESAHLTELLTEKQYTLLLMLKNKPNAYAEAKKDWADLEKRRMTQGLNMEPTVELFANYYIARYSAWNRMAHDKKKQTANMKMLEEIKPQPLKALDAARWNDEPEQPTNSLKLKW